LSDQLNYETPVYIAVPCQFAGLELAVVQSPGLSPTVAVRHRIAYLLNTFS